MTLLEITLVIVGIAVGVGGGIALGAVAAQRRKGASLEEGAATEAKIRGEVSRLLLEVERLESEGRRILVSAQSEAATLTNAAKAAADAEAAATRNKAELEASRVALGARRAAEKEVNELTESARELVIDVERREHRLAEREERLDEDQRRLDQRDVDVSRQGAELAGRERRLAEADAERLAELERISSLTVADARTELLTAVETHSRREAALLARDIEAEAKASADVRARKIIVDTIQRLATDQTTESVVSVLHLPSDDMKGRIIGREGRNIRAFESVTGVNVIIDDTPEAVLLSCFDPVRREMGRLTLERLILDGRIHPHRIEEAYESSRAEVEELCRRAADEALVDVGITDLHDELRVLLGRLKYRTSYGQNVLKHLVECAHIGGMMAAELGMNPTTVKRAAFLHDIGKALTHEVEGSHAIVGADYARRFGESEDIAHAIEAHHNEVQPQTVEAVLTQAADACSGGRPGARRESLEVYVKRLQRIEEIATAKDGVDRVFAMQAGREVRVMVKPESVDDLEAQVLAKEIAKQIEDELTYPGQIRVTVVRESRATEVAH